LFLTARLTIRAPPIIDIRGEKINASAAPYNLKYGIKRKEETVVATKTTEYKGTCQENCLAAVIP